MPGSELELPGFRALLSALPQAAAVYLADEAQSPVAANQAYARLVASGLTASVAMTHTPLPSDNGDVRYVLCMAETPGRAETGSADRLLAETEQELMRFFKSASAGFALVDKTGAVYHVNNAYAALLGCEAAELLAEAIDELVHPESRSQRQQHLQHLIDGTAGTFHVETRYQRRDGGDAWAAETVTVLCANDQTPHCIVIVAHDITRRRQAEQTLMQVESLVSMGRLSASIAHELNNPLESVINLLFLVNQAESLEDVRRYGVLAEQELARVSTIATQTLRFCRPQAEPSALQMSEVLDGVLALFAGRIRCEQVQVERRYHPGTQPLVAFSGELRQVFVNLVGNALDAMESPAKLWIAVKPARNWRTSQEGIRVTVADTGSGIPKTMLTKVFEAFVTTKEKTGTGLGLWISKDIVKRQGGDFCVRSSVSGPRRGTCMSIFLPYRHQHAQLRRNSA